MNEQYVKIWKTIQLIPLGRVSSYGQIADLAGLPGRARLVGKCLKFVPSDGLDNKAVPWHRVIRSSGEIAFSPGSEEFANQRALLIEEGIAVKGKRVSIKEFGWVIDLENILFLLPDY